MDDEKTESQVQREKDRENEKKESQEQREKMLAENADTVKSFGDSGRMMGELWHKLTDDQKEDYRKRAKVVTDQKLKDWQASKVTR